jgi:hypothetical protein
MAIASVAVAFAQQNRVPRTFPQFTGTWVLDEQASTGTLNMAPRIPRTLTIAATPEVLTLNERLRLRPGDNAPESQVRAIRFDGTPTVREGGSFEYQDTFLLVADMLVVSTKTSSVRNKGVFDLATDAFAVEGNVLTLHRQLSHVDPPGHIAPMQFAPNNLHHTFIYRRAPAEPVK